MLNLEFNKKVTLLLIDSISNELVNKMILKKYINKVMNEATSIIMCYLFT
jgi:hypothetical protein